MRDRRAREGPRSLSDDRPPPRRRGLGVALRHGQHFEADAVLAYPQFGFDDQIAPGVFRLPPFGDVIFHGMVQTRAV
ncbi:MAG: hypothetical protein ACR2FH_06265 [Caulobacteraceae bacterium]